MKRDFDLPSRPEMLAGLTEFAKRASGGHTPALGNGLGGGDETILETSDGEYRCRAAVFAIGVTEPWVAPVPASRTLLTTWTRRMRRPTRTSGSSSSQAQLGFRGRAVAPSVGQPGDPRLSATRGHEGPCALAAASSLPPPYDEYARGGPGTYVLDAAIERVERGSDFRVSVEGTTRPFTRRFEVDEVIAATGFRTPLRDLPELGVATVKDGRIPALTPFWESVSVPGIYFANNATQGARIGKRGLGASSSSVNGFQYNARVRRTTSPTSACVSSGRDCRSASSCLSSSGALACAGALDPRAT